MATHPLLDQISSPSYVDESRYERMDGQLVARPVPGLTHSRVQGKIYRLLWEKTKAGEYEVQVEWSLTSPKTVADAVPDYLTPDLLVAAKPFRTAGNGHLISPGFLAIEVRSPQQEGLFSKAQMLVAWGVEHVWIIDPQSQECFEYDGGNALVKAPSELQAGPLSLRMNEIFED